MTKQKSTKRALLASVLSLVLCVSMLVGSTFAWFTDSATTGVNKIVSGNLDIKLSYKNAYDANQTGAAWTEVDANTKDLFVTNTDTDILWEPGVASVCYFKIENLGSLSLKYVMSVLYEDVVTANDGAIKLSDALVSAIVPMDSETVFESSAAAIEAANGTDSVTALGYANDANPTTMSAEDTDYFAMVVYMPETVGNDYNVAGGLAIELYINLVAAQATVENDSFSNEYDANAEYFTTASEDDKIGTAGGELTEDMFFTSAFVDSQGATGELVVNGGGHTVKVDTDEVSYLTSANNSKVEMKDITITGEMPYLSVGNYVSGDAAQKAFNAELNNVTVTELKVNNFNNEKPVAAIICYGTSVLNNCNLSGTTTDDAGHVAFDLMALNNSTVTVNGGYVKSAVVRAKGSMIVDGAKIDLIETGSHGVNGQVGLVIKSGSEIGTVKAYNYNENTNNALYKGHAKITIEAGATVDVLDLTGVTVKSDVTVEEGATVGNVVVDGVSMTFAQWQAA